MLAGKGSRGTKGGSHAEYYVLVGFSSDDCETPPLPRAGGFRSSFRSCHRRQYQGVIESREMDPKRIKCENGQTEAGLFLSDGCQHFLAVPLLVFAAVC